jgi:hypothetical protein
MAPAGLALNDTIEDIFPEAAAVKRRSLGEEVEIPVILQAGPGERSIAGTVALKLLKVFARKEVTKNDQATCRRSRKKAAR